MIEMNPHSPNNSNDPAASTPRAIECPRCGYDLRGIVSTWNERCPLQGTCSECGLEFEWVHTFKQSEHPWLFEYQWRRRPLSSFVRTFGHALRPWRLWREIDLFHPVRPRPLIAMFIIAILFVFVFDYGCILLHIYSWADSWLWFYSLVEVWERVEKHLTTAAALAWIVLVSSLALLLPDSLRRARVRPIHLLRIALYAAIAVSVLVGVVVSIHSVTYWEVPAFWIPVQDAFKMLGRPMAILLRPILGRGAINHAEGATVLYALLPAALVLPYWYWACARYLRLKRPLAVTAALGAITSLILIAIAIGYEDLL